MKDPQAVVALFTGTAPSDMELVGVTVDPGVAAHVAEAMLNRQPHVGGNPVRDALDAGRREALTRLLQTTNRN